MAKGRWGGNDANDESAENKPENDGGDSGTKPSGEGSSAASDEGEMTNEDEADSGEGQRIQILGISACLMSPLPRRRVLMRRAKGKDAGADLENFPRARGERESRQ